MHRVNAGLTVLAPVKPDRVTELRTLLVDLDTRQGLPFSQSATTHFATITIIPAQQYRDEMLPATLLFATSFCGPTRVHVGELVSIMGKQLCDIFSHCEGFDSNDELEDWLVEHRSPDTFYSGMQHLSPADVRRHRELRDAIQMYIEQRQTNGGLPGTAIAARREIQDYVRSCPDLAWTRERFQPTLGAWLTLYWRSLVIEVFLAALVACTVTRHFVDSTVLDVVFWSGWGAVIAFLLVVVVMVASIRDAEDEQAYLAERPRDAVAHEQAETQARPVINEFTLASAIKEEGDLRPMFLRLSLWIIGRVADGFPGVPYLRSGINIPTVATARWIPTDGGRRLMFISNYTNSGEGYVRDFIETRGGAMRINLSFGFGRGFPKTAWIVNRGALTDPNTYLYALSENQLRTLFWYGPYRDISIDNIKLNREIREGLFATYNERKAQEWLHLL